MCIRDRFFEKLIALAREYGIWVVHDLAYADICFDGWKAPSIMQVPGARDVAVEFFTLSKSYNMAGWRVGFMVGNRDLVNALARIKGYHDYGTFTPIQVAAIAALEGPQDCVAEIVHALARMKSYHDYGTFTPIQVASIVALEGPQDCVRDIAANYQKRRDVLARGLNEAGWNVDVPKATMYIWAKIPEPYLQMGSLEFAKKLLADAKVAVSPGVGFGEFGDDHVRFALIENEARIRQAVRGVKEIFRKDGLL